MSTKNELLSDIQQVWLNLHYTSQKLEGEVYEIVSSAEQLLWKVSQLMSYYEFRQKFHKNCSKFPKNSELKKFVTLLQVQLPLEFKWWKVLTVWQHSTATICAFTYKCVHVHLCNTCSCTDSASFQLRKF